MNTININRFAFDIGTSFPLMMCTMSNQCRRLRFRIHQSGRFSCVCVPASGACVWWKHCVILIIQPFSVCGKINGISRIPQRVCTYVHIRGEIFFFFSGYSNNSGVVTNRPLTWIPSGPPGPACVAVDWSRHKLITITHSSNWPGPVHREAADRLFWGSMGWSEEVAAERRDAEEGGGMCV